MTQPSHTSEPACLIGDHCPGTPLPIHGARWCARHANTWTSALASIDAAWYMLDALPDSLSPITGAPGRRARGAAPPAPANLQALALTDSRTRYAPVSWLTDTLPSYDVMDADIAAPVIVLGYWCGVIASRVGGQVPPASVNAMVRWLSQHRDAAARLESADHLYADTMAVKAHVQAAVGDGEERPLGECPRLIGEAECCGAIWPQWPTDPTDPLGARCSSCGEQWTGVDLIRLQLILATTKTLRA